MGLFGSICNDKSRMGRLLRNSRIAARYIFADTINARRPFLEYLLPKQRE